MRKEKRIMWIDREREQRGKEREREREGSTGIKMSKRCFFLTDRQPEQATLSEPTIIQTKPAAKFNESADWPKNTL